MQYLSNSPLPNLDRTHYSDYLSLWYCKDEVFKGWKHFNSLDCLFSIAWIGIRRWRIGAVLSPREYSWACPMYEISTCDTGSWRIIKWAHDIDPLNFFKAGNSHLMAGPGSMDEWESSTISFNLVWSCKSWRSWSAYADQEKERSLNASNAGLRTTSGSCWYPVWEWLPTHPERNRFQVGSMVTAINLQQPDALRLTGTRGNWLASRLHIFVAKLNHRAC